MGAFLGFVGNRSLKDSPFFSVGSSVGGAWKMSLRDSALLSAGSSVGVARAPAERRTSRRLMVIIFVMSSGWYAEERGMREGKRKRERRGEEVAYVAYILFPLVKLKGFSHRD